MQATVVSTSAAMTTAVSSNSTAIVLQQQQQHQRQRRRAVNLHAYSSTPTTPRVRVRATEFELITDLSYLFETVPATLPAGHQYQHSPPPPAVSIIAVRINQLEDLNQANVAKVAAAAEETARAASAIATTALAQAPIAPAPAPAAPTVAAPAPAPEHAFVTPTAADPKPAARKKRATKSPTVSSHSSSDVNSNVSTVSQSSSSSNRVDDRDYNPLVKTPKAKATKASRQRKRKPAKPKKPAIKRTRAKKASSTRLSYRGDCSIRWMDHVVLPVEPLESNDLDAPQFMRALGLCTHELRQTLEARGAERKRRTVTSTEKPDFHYGNLDQNEQQYSKAAAAAKLKRALLQSPPRTRTRSGRRPNAAAKAAADAEAARDMAAKSFLSASTAGASTAHAVREPSMEKEIVMQAPRKTYAKRGAAKRKSAEMVATVATAKMDDELCKSCNKTTFELVRQCSASTCNAAYHLSCHTTANIPSQSPLQMSAAAFATPALTDHDSFCPACVCNRATASAEPPSKRHKSSKAAKLELAEQCK